LDLSFILDPLLLIASGIAEVYIVEKWMYKHTSRRKGMIILSSLVMLLFWSIAGALYLDLLNVPFLGDFGNGNHFMWNSGVELLGFPPFVDTTTPTYTKAFGVLNLIAIVLFCVYPVWLYLGISCGFKIIKKGKRTDNY